MKQTIPEALSYSAVWRTSRRRQMYRHRFGQILALLMAALVVLSACGGTTPPTGGAATSAPGAATTAPAAAEATAAPAAGGEAVTVTWGFWGSPEEKASHEKVAAEFMKTHPNIKIEVW